MFCGIVMMASAPSATAAMAALDSASITLGDVRVERSESFLNCGFTMKFDGIDIPSNKELRLNPVIVGADGSAPSGAYSGRAQPLSPGYAP